MRQADKVDEKRFKGLDFIEVQIATKASEEETQMNQHPKKTVSKTRLFVRQFAKTSKYSFG